LVVLTVNKKMGSSQPTTAAGAILK